MQIDSNPAAWRRLFQFVSEICFSLNEFPMAWGLSRGERLIRRAAPMLLVTAAVAGLLGPDWGTERSMLSIRYHTAASAALSSGDFSVAELCLRKLQLLGSRHPALEFDLALRLRGQGRMKESERILSRLTAVDQPGDVPSGYAPAHLWLARALLQDANRSVGPSTGRRPLTPQKQQAALAHLQATVKLDPHNAEAHALLGQLFLATKNLDLAAEHLALAVETRPALHLTLARVQLALGQPIAAGRQARAASSFYRRRVKDSPTSVEDRLLWADAQILLEDYATAATILKDGMASTGDRRFRTAAAALHVAWYDAIARMESRDFTLQQQHDLLQRALEFVPKYSPALDRMSALENRRASQDFLAETGLESTMPQSDSQALVYRLLGTAALEQGDIRTALPLLEDANLMAPRRPQTMNNLAWALAHADPPQLDRASRIIDAAVQLAPRHPEIRETRGQIRAMQRRWQEAVVDLEFARKVLPRRASLHQTLATVYEHLHDTELAAKHRALADEK